VLLDGRPGDTLLIELTNPVAPVAPVAVGSVAPVASAGPVGPTVNGSGTGLIGLTERVRLAGGELEHAISADGEFWLRARLPWPA
jgi:hypothetical protein